MIFQMHAYLKALTLDRFRTRITYSTLKTNSEKNRSYNASEWNYYRLPPICLKTAVKIQCARSYRECHNSHLRATTSKADNNVPSSRELVRFDFDICR
jgi:hypothetical protein